MRISNGSEKPYWVWVRDRDAVDRWCADLEKRAEQSDWPTAARDMRSAVAKVRADEASLIWS